MGGRAIGKTLRMGGFGGLREKSSLGRRRKVALLGRNGKARKVPKVDKKKAVRLKIPK